jgi:hypothetical protein
MRLRALGEGPKDAVTSTAAKAAAATRAGAVLHVCHKLLGAVGAYTVKKLLKNPRSNVRHYTWCTLNEAERAERRYRTLEPENRLVARGSETEWENRLRDLAAAETELRRREQQRPSSMSPEQLQDIKKFRLLYS